MTKVITGLEFDPEKLQRLNEVTLQDKFQERLNEVRKINVTITQKPAPTEILIPNLTSGGDQLVSSIEEIKGYDLIARNGDIFSKQVGFGGYDESKYKFLSLEGEAHITCHSVAYYLNQDIFPVCKMTFYFYTRSKNIVDHSKLIKYTEDCSDQANLDYAVDRNEFIENYAIDNTIMFIDGPMIGGNISSFSLKLVEDLHRKNIIPIFLVKNSDSNLVVDHYNELRSHYNSDLHWAYTMLKQGQRSSLYHYTDKVNPANTKLFCYYKSFKGITPQRIEFHPDTYILYKDYFPNIFDLLYYLLLLHGDKANPQIRPIAVAEKYAREIIKTINIELLLRNSSLIQTMNQGRFGGEVS
ncbi:MAG TPA: hypothetical protein HA367_01000 [Candidatus Methanofastidiosum sp.]|jgi:hypothetical protein|nr:hypothetical protein [Methanofastidiosum sp.]